MNSVKARMSDSGIENMHKIAISSTQVLFSIPNTFTQPYSTARTVSIMLKTKQVMGIREMRMLTNVSSCMNLDNLVTELEKDERYENHAN